MPITVNEGGTLYELDTITSNEGGTLYELDCVHANEGGILYEIHSGWNPPALTWYKGNGGKLISSTDIKNGSRVTFQQYGLEEYQGNLGTNYHFLNAAVNTTGVSSSEVTLHPIALSAGNKITIKIIDITPTSLSNCMIKLGLHRSYGSSADLTCSVSSGSGSVSGMIGQSSSLTVRSSHSFYLLSLGALSVVGGQFGTTYNTVNATVEVTIEK